MHAMPADEFLADLQAKLNRVRQETGEVPVAMVLSDASPQARAIYHDLTGETLAEPDADVEPRGPVRTIPRSQAVTLLRRHAGEGGGAAAKQLEDESLLPVWWFVAMWPTAISYTAFDNGLVQLMSATLLYDGPNHHARRTMGEMIDSNAPGMLNLKTQDGEVVPIFGRDGFSTAAAGCLVAAVASRRMSLPDKGRTVEVPVNEDCLASMLKNVYADQPHQVAEALTALKKMKGGKDRWLRQVLWGRPELRPLAEAVQRELTGK